MAENFLTYPEVDPNSRITVTSSRVSWTNLTGNEDAYVYKDKGVDYFSGNFVHLLAVNCSVAAQGGSETFPWALTNALDDIKGLADALASLLCLRFSNPENPNALLFYVQEYDSGTQYESGSYTMTKGTTYYLKIVRDEAVGTYGTLYCYIYSNAARTTLLATLSVTLHTSKKDYRYIHAVITRNTANTLTQTAYSEDLTIEGGAASVLPEVTIQAMTSIAATTATGNGYITSLGNSAVTEHGHCWATTVNPTTASSKTTNGAGAVGAFTSAITGLTAGTTYYVRAYATNSYGTAYSSGISFISGDATSITIKGNLKVVGTDLVYVGSDGKTYTLTGT